MRKRYEVRNMDHGEYEVTDLDGNWPSLDGPRPILSVVLNVPAPQINGFRFLDRWTLVCSVAPPMSQYQMDALNEKLTLEAQL